MSIRQELFQQAADPGYWRQLNPSLAVSEHGSHVASECLTIDWELIVQTKERLRSEGYFELDRLLAPAQMDILASAVQTIWQVGWPTPYAVVYDEYWQMFQALQPLFASILGANYKQVPNFWCWYIDKTTLSRGWGLHRDRPSVNTVSPDGLPTTLTVWIPLTDATVLNGCIYVLPANLDPNFPDYLQSFEVPDIANMRALPAQRGSVLGWSEGVLHLGSRSSDRANNPRVSISFTFQRGDVNPYETPLFDPLVLPSFEERLAFIGQNVVKYKTQGNINHDHVAVASKLSIHIPPIIVQDGFRDELLGLDKRLSETLLWPLQRDYFTREGVRAWEVVPFYATSRALFCEMYADMLVNFLLDQQDKINYDSELFIVEIGGGTGCFAYRFLNELMPKLQNFKYLSQLKLRYILTDFTENIVNQWMTNKKLDVHRRSGILDYSVFRPEKDNKLSLLNSKRELTKSDWANPLIVIANYFFDSIEQDAFRVNDGELEEVKFTIHRSERDCLLSMPIAFENLHMEERYFNIEGAYYGESSLDSILEYYRTSLNQASIIFPIGAARIISNLINLSNRDMVLFAVDKGFNTLESRQIAGHFPQTFSVHGSFSFDVNFDAIARYIENQGGVSLNSGGNRSGLCASANVISQGGDVSVDHLRHYFESTLVKKNLINSLFEIEELLCTSTYPGTIDRSWLSLLLSIIRTYNFEPVVFTIAYLQMFVNLDAELDAIGEQQKSELMDVLTRVSRNIYRYDQKHDALDCLLRLLIRLKCFDECLRLCQESLEAFGPVGTILDNFAICYESTGRLELANQYFQESLKLAPEHEWARAGVDRTKHLIDKLSQARI